MASYDSGYQERKRFHEEDTEVENWDGVYYLPHQCDGWKIGDVADVEALIADLQKVLNESTSHG